MTKMIASSITLEATLPVETVLSQYIIKVKPGRLTVGLEVKKLPDDKEPRCDYPRGWLIFTFTDCEGVLWKAHRRLTGITFVDYVLSDEFELKLWKEASPEQKNALDKACIMDIKPWYDDEYSMGPVTISNVERTIFTRNGYPRQRLCLRKEEGTFLVHESGWQEGENERRTPPFFYELPIVDICPLLGVGADVELEKTSEVGEPQPLIQVENRSSS